MPGRTKQYTDLLSIHVTSDMYQRVKASAEAANQPVTWWVRTAIEETLARRGQPASEAAPNPDPRDLMGEDKA